MRAQGFDSTNDHDDDDLGKMIKIKIGQISMEGWMFVRSFEESREQGVWSCMIWMARRARKEEEEKE